MAVQLITYAAQRYIGLSSDTRPQDGTVAVGAVFQELDTGLVWEWDGASWRRAGAVATADVQGNQLVASPYLNELQEHSRLLRKLIAGLEIVNAQEFPDVE